MPQGFQSPSRYEAQRKDPSLARNIRRPEAPFKVSGDGVLEKVTLRTRARLSVFLLSQMVLPERMV